MSEYSIFIYDFSIVFERIFDGNFSFNLIIVFQPTESIFEAKIFTNSFLRTRPFLENKKYQKYLPYFPVCKKCNRLYTAEATEYIADKKIVKYNCHDTEIGSKMIKGCGHQGEADITKDLGKLAWKVEFAARWSAFDIRFEAYGSR